MILVRKFLALLLCICFPISSLAANPGYKIAYDGGSVQDLKPNTPVTLYIDGPNIRIADVDKTIALIPASAVTEISYGQDVHRRVGEAIAVGVFTWGIGGLLALSKSKKHFIGLTWDNGGQKGGFAFRAGKNDYRGILTGLEGITGKKAIDTAPMNVKN